MSQLNAPLREMISAVVDGDVVAVAGGVPSEGDRACRCGDDRARIGQGDQVLPSVESWKAGDGVDAGPER